MADTAIEWTDVVWNPTTGCDRVSPGCDHCYALTMAKRLKGMGQPKYQRDGDPRTSGPGFGLTVHPDAVHLPMQWRQPRKIFVNSMSDLFHQDVPTNWIADVFAVMATAQQHTYQLLTKRHARMRYLLTDDEFVSQVRSRALGKGMDPAAWSWPLRRLCLGVSAEDQHWADIRIGALADTPAAIRWVSAEPLLGEIDLSEWMWADDPSACDDPEHCSPLAPSGRIGWVVAGGESGPGARPMHPRWARSLRDQCAAAGVPFLFKQRGAWTWDTRPGIDPWASREPDLYVHADGRTAGEQEALADGGSWLGVWRVGKKAAGRTLDGTTHDEYPTPTEANR